MQRSDYEQHLIAWNYANEIQDHLTDALIEHMAEAGIVTGECEFEADWHPGRVDVKFIGGTSIGIPISEVLRHT